MFTEQQSNEIIKRRHEIVLAYCKEKGWDSDPSKISLNQIMEIRGQQNWKDVPKNVSEESVK